ncbi:MAG: hypothetical protein H0W82_07720 [Actinobacteria bacterium]|nr:hypothetical protein [Actinomycetota bacterium]
MEWMIDRRSATLRVDFDEGPPPSRDEVERFLQQMAPALDADGVRRLSVNGETVVRRRSLSMDDVALPLHYEAAQRRAVQRKPGSPPQDLTGT